MRRSADAIDWVLASTGNQANSLIGVEVSTGNGDWRTCRLADAACSVRCLPRLGAIDRW